MKRLLIALLIATTLAAETRIHDIGSCISVSVTPHGVGKVQVIAENKCGVKLSLVQVALKYFDKDGYRIASDGDSKALDAPYFGKGEKIRRIVPLVPGSARAEVRDVWGMQ